MSESNKVPIQATPEQQASMAASGLVGSLFTPGAAAGTHGSSQGHGTAPTSKEKNPQAAPGTDQLLDEGFMLSLMIYR